MSYDNDPATINVMNYQNSGRIHDTQQLDSMGRKSIFRDNIIDISPLKDSKPPELDFIWDSYLAGSVGVLVAPGGTGKSMFALQASMGVASADPSADLLSLRPKHHGPVVYLAGEEPRLVLDNRLHDMAQHLDPEAWDDIAKNLIIVSLYGKRIDLTDQIYREDLIDLACAHKARMIVIDTLSRVHNLDENSNRDMSFLISCCEEVTLRTKSSVLPLHHVGKGAARSNQGDGQQAARGASALIDNARYCGYITAMTETQAQSLVDPNRGYMPISEDQRHEYVQFGTSKANYGKTSPPKFYVRSEGGVLLPAHLRPAPGKAPSRRDRL